MQAFDRVTEAWGKLKYMDLTRARHLREHMLAHGSTEILELGFFHGKSSAYIAAILEDARAGHLTTIDLAGAKQRKPAIAEVVESVQLSHRVTPIYAHRSFTWELAKLIKANPRPQFDLCYLDGGHTWDVTGFAFVLVDMLLKPGGWIVLDDLDWSIATSQAAQGNARSYANFDHEEKEARGVRMVFELIAPHLGYVNLTEHRQFRWGFAQKPAI